MRNSESFVRLRKPVSRAMPSLDQTRLLLGSRVLFKQRDGSQLVKRVYAVRVDGWVQLGDDSSGGYSVLIYDA